jgi:large repetitive protein
MARPSGRFTLVLGILALACLVVGLFAWKRLVPRGTGGPTQATASRGPSLFAADVDDLSTRQPAGGIEGVVLDAEGLPVVGASVVLVRMPSREAAWAPNNGRPLQVAHSSANGAFSFKDVAPGTYGVTAMAARHAPGQRTPVLVKSQQATQVEVKLGAGGFALRGRVFDLSGGTVPGAKVTAREIFMNSTEAQGAPRVLQATADQNGNYELFLGRAQYSLRAEADGYAPASDWFALTADATRDLRLSPASGIAGRVVERGSQQGVAEAELWVVVQGSRFGGSRPRDVKTDGEGRFWFNDLDPGSYRVGARKGRLVGMSGTVSVALAQRVDDVQVEIHPGFVVAGRTLDRAGKPLGDVRVDLFKNEPPMDRPLFAKTGPDGTFRMEGVLPAEYRLSVRSDGFAPLQQPVRVAADVPNLELKLAAEATVTGKVLGVDGRPLEGATVHAMVQGRGSGNMERATSAADGAFTIKPLGAGDLTVTATHETGVATVKDEKLADAEAKVLTLRLAPGASISGTIKLDDGRPAPGARIQAQSWGSGGAGRWNETAGQDGGYRLKGITPGRVIIVASNGPGMRWGGPDRPDQKTLTLAEGENKSGVDLIVAGGKKITGTVVDPAGKPVAGAEVTAGPQEPDGRALRRPGMSMDGRAFSQPDGSFVLEGVGGGKHTVWAVQAGFGDAELKDVDGGATGLKLQFPAEATVSGLVTDPQGKPVSDYTISLAPGPKTGESAADKRTRQSMGAWDAPTDTVHDPSGQFFLRRVSAGTHELRARTVDGSSATLIVEISAGEKKQGVRVVLDRGARLVGRVVDMESNQPLPDVEVRAFSPSMLNRSPIRTDGSGAFAIDGVSVGDSVQVMIFGDRKTHLGERRTVEVTKGTPQVDLGTIRLTRGNIEARLKEGTWEGVSGISNSEDEKAMVAQARPGAPAEKAGVKTGDAILAIDGKDVRGLGFGGVEWHLRGRPGAPITVTVQTPGQAPRTVTFNRISNEEQQALFRQQQAAKSGASGGATPASGSTPRAAR